MSAKKQMSILYIIINNNKFAEIFYIFRSNRHYLWRKKAYRANNLQAEMSNVHHLFTNNVEFKNQRHRVDYMNKFKLIVLI